MKPLCQERLARTSTQYYDSVPFLIRAEDQQYRNFLKRTFVRVPPEAWECSARVA